MADHDVEEGCAFWGVLVGGAKDDSMNCGSQDRTNDRGLMGVDMFQVR